MIYTTREPYRVIFETAPSWEYPSRTFAYECPWWRAETSDLLSWLMSVQATQDEVEDALVYADPRTSLGLPDFPTRSGSLRWFHEQSYVLDRFFRDKSDEEWDAKYEELKPLWDAEVKRKGLPEEQWLFDDWVFHKAAHYHEIRARAEALDARKRQEAADGEAGGDPAGVDAA